MSGPPPHNQFYNHQYYAGGGADAYQGYYDNQQGGYYQGYYYGGGYPGYGYPQQQQQLQQGGRSDTPISGASTQYEPVNDAVAAGAQNKYGVRKYYSSESMNKLLYDPQTGNKRADASNAAASKDRRKEDSTKESALPLIPEEVDLKNTRKQPRSTTATGRFFDRLCCCFPTSYVGRWICCIIVFIILAGLGVAGFLFFPRFPAFMVQQINTKSVNAFEFIRSPDPALYNNLNHMTVRLNLNMNVSVYNPNWYHLKVDTLQLNAFLNVNQSDLAANGIRPALLGFDAFVGTPPTPPPGYTPNYNPNIGQANRSQLIFPAKSNVTFSMNFTFSYSPDPNVGLIKDPAFAQAVSMCGLQGTQRASSISYSAVNTVSILSKIGYNPSVNGMIKINCPISQSQIDAAQFAIKNGVDPITALGQVFNAQSGAMVGADGAIMPGEM